MNLKETAKITHTTAICMGIDEALEEDNRFEKYTAQMSDGNEILYYVIKEEHVNDFQNIIKNHIRACKDNALFTYDPKDFEKAVDAMKRYVEDNTECITIPQEYFAGSAFRESYSDMTWEESIKKDILENAKYTQDLIDEIEARINDK